MPFAIPRIIRNPLATTCERTTAPILHAARHQQNMVVLPTSSRKIYAEQRFAREE